MRLFLLTFSILTMSVLSFLGISQLTSSNEVLAGIRESKKQSLRFSKELDDILKCRQQTPRSLALSYKDFHNYMNVISDYHGAEAVVKIPGYKDQLAIEKYFKEASLAGVKKLNVDVIFRKGGSVANQISIIDSLLVSGKYLSFEIVSVSKSKYTLSVNLNLYGI